MAEALPDAINALHRRGAANIITDFDLSAIRDDQSWLLNVASSLHAEVPRSGLFVCDLSKGAKAIGATFERWAKREIQKENEAREFALKYILVSPERQGRTPLPQGPSPKDSPRVATAEELQSVRTAKEQKERAEEFAKHESTPEGALRQLGVMRWRYFAIERGKSFTTAALDPALRASRPGGFSDKGNPLLFPRPSDFNEACRSAFEMFQAMFPKEVPRHYTSSWRK